MFSTNLSFNGSILCVVKLFASKSSHSLTLPKTIPRHRWWQNLAVGIDFSFTFFTLTHNTQNQKKIHEHMRERFHQIAPPFPLTSGQQILSLLRMCVVSRNRLPSLLDQTVRRKVQKSSSNKPGDRST